MSSTRSPQASSGSTADPAKARVLIVDDDERNLRLYSSFLGRDHEVATASTGADALQTLEEQAFDVVVTDLRMPGMSGLDLSSNVRERHPDVELVMVTGEADLDSAVEALRVGISDFLRKPFGRHDLVGAIERSLDRKRILTALSRAQYASTQTTGGRRLLGASPAMERLRLGITRVQNTATTVLVLGETGTGKELVARAIHEGGDRASKSFVALNCAAVASELLEAELFGHEKGAFTGAERAKAGLIEEADGGTFFLDEVGELPEKLQAKFLRVLQEREVMRVGATTPRKVDVRVVAATHRDLAAEVAEGRFRQDLFYRLNVFPIRTPPLRARAGDIPELAERFLQVKADEFGVPAGRLGDELLAELQRRPWPGNVRELQNLLERLILIGEGPVYQVADLEAAVGMDQPVAAAPAPAAAAPALAAPGAPAPAANLEEVVLAHLTAGGLPTLAELERAYVRHVLDANDGNKSAAARVLDIHPATLNRKLSD